ncbi:hypothetical protein AVEN_77638-1 [Araneus ventricosus]|uniref:HTH psq-type domain-containing protein n=1 Tax=Araneus ventricosus TaxID=182803 RepID=A0A4Y2ITY5_ARAVE|nr:hypothetical protein AVEN_77638-1 [Araneus ventricosus]
MYLRICTILGSLSVVLFLIVADIPAAYTALDHNSMESAERGDSKISWEFCSISNNSEFQSKKLTFFHSRLNSQLRWELSFPDKLNIIKEIDDGVKQVDAAKKYGLAQSTIATFLKKRKQIEKA